MVRNLMHKCWSTKKISQQNYHALYSIILFESWERFINHQVTEELCFSSLEVAFIQLNLLIENTLGTQKNSGF